MHAADSHRSPGLPTPRLAAKAAKIRRGRSRQTLGGGFLFVQPPPARVKGLIHAVPQGADTTLCGIDASTWRIVPGIGWTTRLDNGCPECVALTPRYESG
jgi:hypothetical protein